MGHCLSCRPAVLPRIMYAWPWNNMAADKGAVQISQENIGHVWKNPLDVPDACGTERLRRNRLVWRYVWM